MDYCVVSNETRHVTNESFSLEFPNFSVLSNAPDKISELALYAKSPDFSFSLGVEAKTSKVVLNGGNGVIAWGPHYGSSTHWSIPAARTSGMITLGGNDSLELDPSRSFTWYDHQITYGAPKNFTWFEVHFPDPEVRVSIWAYDWPDSSDAWRFATVRLHQETTLVLPFAMEADWDNAWVSTSNHTFPQSWTLKFDNGDYLKLKSVREDQEIQSGGWTGFITAEKSRFFGQTYGFGVADVIYS